MVYLLVQVRRTKLIHIILSSSALGSIWMGQSSSGNRQDDIPCMMKGVSVNMPRYACMFE